MQATSVSPREQHRRSEQRQQSARLLRVSDMPWGRTKTYQLIAGGQLVAVKSGRSTFITGDSFAAYCDSLPRLAPKAGAGGPADVDQGR